MGKDRIRKLHLEIFERMSEFYLSQRTRCFIIRNDQHQFSADFCQVLQPFEVRDREEVLWESESVIVVEEHRNLSGRVDPADLLRQHTVKVAGRNALLSEDADETSIFSDTFHGPHWRRRYHCLSDGIVFRLAMQGDRTAHGLTNETIRDEIQFHPISPFNHSGELMNTFAGSESDFLRRAVAELAAPFWARISQAEIDGNAISVEYEIPSGMEERVNAWKSTETGSGELIKEKVGLKVADTPGTGPFRRYVGEYAILRSIQDVTSLTISLNLDDRYGIGYERREIGPSRADLWSLIEEQEIRPGKLKSMIEGNEKAISIDSFEFAIGLLLTSYGFRVAYTGKMFEPGPDLLAVGPDTNTIVVVECGRAKFKEKLSACSERLEILRTQYPEYSCIGATFTSTPVSDDVRRTLTYPDISLFDRDDIARLLEQLKQRPDTEKLLDLMKRGFGGISWGRY